MKLMILGATGMVGRHVLQAALDDSRIEYVLAPSRRPLETHAKLTNPVGKEIDALLANVCMPMDAVICAIGTTISKAKSRTAFRHVDYEIPMEFARTAYGHGAKAIALVSSPGASMKVPLFYSRTKAELERDIATIGFQSVTILRPGMIGGEREEFRLAERLILPIARLLKPKLPTWLWINPPETIARLLLEAVIVQEQGIRRMTASDVARATVVDL